MDLSGITINPDERKRLMDKVQRGKRLTQDEALRVSKMLLEIIEQDDKARADAELFLATLAARYGIEIKAD